MQLVVLSCVSHRHMPFIVYTLHVCMWRGVEMCVPRGGGGSSRYLEYITWVQGWLRDWPHHPPFLFPTGGFFKLSIYLHGGKQWYFHDDNSNKSRNIKNNKQCDPLVGGWQENNRFNHQEKWLIYNQSNKAGSYIHTYAVYSQCRQYNIIPFSHTVNQWRSRLRYTWYPARTYILYT